MRIRRELRPTPSNKSVSKQDRSMLGNLVHWWQSLTVRQRIILLACILLVIGTMVGIYLRVSAKPNRAAKEKKIARPSEFFSKPVRKCVPLTERPEKTEHNKNLAVTYLLQNTATDWLETLKFGFEDNLLKSDGYDKRYRKKELNHKLKRLQDAIQKANFSSFQRTALSGTEFRIVRGEYILNHNAMVEAASGNVYINADLDPDEYKTTIQNEIAHVEAFYINVVKCGAKLPENKFLTGYPFVTADWQIDHQLQDQLETALNEGHQAVLDYFALHNPSNHGSLTPENIILKNTVDQLLSTAYQLPLNQALSQFSTSYYQRLGLTLTISEEIGGRSQRLTEQVSDIREYPAAIQHYFYGRVEDYLRRYYAMSCIMETENTSSSQPGYR